MRNFINPPRIIRLNNEETYLLAYWVSDNGIVLEVSGPQSFLLDNVKAEEYDGTPLKLN